MRVVAFLLAAMSVVTAGSALAQGAKMTSAIEFARQADALKPGEWVWAPEIAPDGPISVYVDLSRQIATVYRNGVRIGVSTVSTGKPGHETPTGVFSILEKDPDHHSKKYHNAPMLFQERLTWDGIALHAGGLPGYPESHGCIHLPLQFARQLFGITHMGGTVIVAGEAGNPVAVASAGVLGPAGDGGVSAHTPLAEDETWRWSPELSPKGPLTLIVSRSDKRIVALRNGIEIGRARVELPDEDFETHVMTYAPGADGASRWIYVGVPGHGGEKGKPFDMTVLSKVRMAPEFLSSVRAAIQPGATILVTQAPVLPETTGKQLAVLASQ